jgi:hypothetical protein
MHEQKAPSPERELSRARQQLCDFPEGGSQPHALAVIIAENDFDGAMQLFEIKDGKRRYHIAGMHNQADTALVEHVNRLTNSWPVVMRVCYDADKMLLHGVTSLSGGYMASGAHLTSAMVIKKTG